MNKQKGFTLIEVLVSVAIFSFTVLAVLTLLQLGHLTWHQDIGLLELHQNIRLALDGMSREIRQSEPASINISESGARIDFTVDSASISYYLNDQILIREHPVGTTKILCSDVSDLDFSSDGSMVQIQLTGTKNILDRDILVSLVQKVRLRNE
ncbi:MAG: type II secretion system GspH family protein [Candidatus Omnitrophica bacterium]|nr:type II secretion system GspH family protein [Candidatus Omnitrophota bacterium]